MPGRAVKPEICEGRGTVRLGFSEGGRGRGGEGGYGAGGDMGIFCLPRRW